MNIEFMFPLRQLHWWLGMAAIALTLIILGLRALERRRQARLALFVDAQLAPRLLPGYDHAMRRPLFWLTVAGFASLALTFAQPHWGKAWKEVRQNSHDIVICLDTSESMRAANPVPSRIERAKQKIMSLLDMAPADRFGLVAFAGGAAVQSPLTRDHGYLKAVLSAVDTDTISQEGTDIAAALREAAKVFSDESKSTGIIDNSARAILLISDGEQVKGDAVAEAEKAAQYAHVYVIGVGDPNGAEIRLPDWMGRYVRVKDADKPHLSKLDEETLSKVAMSGNGGYIRSTPDNSDVEQIFDNLKQLATYTTSSDVRLRLVNRYQWPLALAIACFAGEGLWIALMPWLRARRLRRASAATAAWNSISTEEHHA